ncbi:hypothetical protein CRYUN_Cryun05aG0068900 [Craigia yunnanensis]
MELSLASVGTFMFNSQDAHLVDHLQHFQLIKWGVNRETNFVLATWRLRTYLKLPWRPLISIDGSTFYELDEKFTIVRSVGMSLHLK